MNKLPLFSLFLLVTGFCPLNAQETQAGEKPTPGILSPDEIKAFSENSPAVQSLLTAALELSKKQLSYKMASSDPSLGGMDCSGTIYHLLRAQGITAVPRASNEQYRWAWNAGDFVAVNGRSQETFELALLKPGYLLFWEGTYATVDRDPPVSHVMIYLGKRTKDDKPVMFGASDGRTYEGKQRWGVGVFDFRMPAAKSTSRFLGYSPIPGLDYSTAK